MEADREIRFRGSNLRELERRNQMLQQELESYGGDLYDLQGEIQELQDEITEIHRRTADSNDTSFQQEILDKMKEIQTKYERMDEVAYHRHQLFLEPTAFTCNALSLGSDEMAPARYAEPNFLDLREAHHERLDALDHNHHVRIRPHQRVRWH